MHPKAEQNAKLKLYTLCTLLSCEKVFPHIYKTSHIRSTNVPAKDLIFFLFSFYFATGFLFSSFFLNIASFLLAHFILVSIYFHSIFAFYLFDFILV